MVKIKCIFWKKCELFYPESNTCQSGGGPYCGKWRSFKLTEPTKEQKRIRKNRINVFGMFLFWLIFCLSSIFWWENSWDTSLQVSAFGLIVSVMVYAVTYTPKKVWKEIENDK